MSNSHLEAGNPTSSPPSYGSSVTKLAEMLLFGMVLHDEMVSSGFYDYVERNICPVTNLVRASFIVNIMRFLYVDKDLRKYVDYTEEQQEMKELWAEVAPLVAQLGIKFYKYTLESQQLAEAEDQPGDVETATESEDEGVADLYEADSSNVAPAG